MTEASAIEAKKHLCDWSHTLSTWFTNDRLRTNQPHHRLTVYRELFFTNLESFIEPVFPIARTLVSDNTWAEWISTFARSEYRVSPFFHTIAEHFLEMLSAYSSLNISPALLQLMRWEWLEMAIDISPEIITKSTSKHSINKTLRIETFDYPVHQMASQGQLLPAQETVLLTWRTHEHDVKAWCPDEITLQLILHINTAENQANTALYENIWETISSTPALSTYISKLQQKDILV